MVSAYYDGDGGHQGELGVPLEVGDVGHAYVAHGGADHVEGGFHVVVEGAGVGDVGVHEKPLDEEDRRKYRRISYSLLIVCDAITIAAAILTVPALYYPITCGMFLEAVLLSVGKICNHSKYGSA